MSDEKPSGLALLRVPFPENQISKLPKATKKQNDDLKADFKKGIRCQLCGGWHLPDVVHLDYVGHAALTDRLLDADPNWTWEPVSTDVDGLPRFDKNGGLWIKLTVCGLTRLGYGNAEGKQGGDAIKEIIGDALRNAAMRFGAALDLWHKGDLHADPEEPPKPPAPPKSEKARATATKPSTQGKMATTAEIKVLTTKCLELEISIDEQKAMLQKKIGRPSWKDLTAVELLRAREGVDELAKAKEDQLPTTDGMTEPPEPDLNDVFPEDVGDPGPPPDAVEPPPPEEPPAPPKAAQKSSPASRGPIPKDAPPPMPKPNEQATKASLDALWEHGLKKGLTPKDIDALVIRIVGKMEWARLTNFQAKAIRNAIDSWNTAKGAR